MRVVVETPEELIIRHRPWVLPLLLAALVLGLLLRTLANYSSTGTSDLVGTALGVVTGTMILALVARRSEFRCDARLRQLQWKQRGLLSSSGGILPLEDICGLSMETDNHRDGPADRVVLLTTRGRLPLTPHYSGMEPHRQTRRAIRGWLCAQGLPAFQDAGDDSG